MWDFIHTLLLLFWFFVVFLNSSLYSLTDYWVLARIFGPAGGAVTLGCGDQCDGAPVSADHADRANRDSGA